MKRMLHLICFSLIVSHSQNLSNVKNVYKGNLPYHIMSKSHWFDLDLCILKVRKNCFFPNIYFINVFSLFIMLKI